MSRRGGINRAFSWVKKVLEVTEVTLVPQLVLPEVQPGIDLFGWDPPRSTNGSFVSGGATTSVLGFIVPDGFQDLIFAASVQHNEAAATHSLGIVSRGADNQSVGVETMGLVPPDTKVCLSRPFLIEPGGRIGGESATSIAVASSLFLNIRFIRIPIGEYVPGSPWG